MFFSIKAVLTVYAIILVLGIFSIVTDIHYAANIAGFIASIGFLVVFFKDPQKNPSAEEQLKIVKFKKYWYMVFATGLLFSLIFGSFWNNQMGGMV